jgi:hypothetical protein
MCDISTCAQETEDPLETKRTFSRMTQFRAMVARDSIMLIECPSMMDADPSLRTRLRDSIRSHRLSAERSR